MVALLMRLSLSFKILYLAAIIAEIVCRVLAVARAVVFPMRMRAVYKASSCSFLLSCS